MKAPSFWWRSTRGPTAFALAPAAWMVGEIATRRMRRAPSARLDVPVLCIGNPTVGGAGKTPLAVAVARVLRTAGASPVFLTRGYGGTVRAPTLVRDHRAADVGDEPLILAGVAPTVVSPDRAAGGRLAATLGDVVVMDDGFQNPQIAKTWSALVIDAAVGIGNGMVTPAGPLRAPMAPQLARADAIVVTEPDDHARASLPDMSLPLHRVRLRPVADVSLDGIPVVAFAGIGRPAKFFASLDALGARIVSRHAFADHHRFTEADATAILRLADAVGAQPATTRKDHVRLADGGPNARRLAAASLVVDVDADLPDALVAALMRACVL